jgi:lipopolysaccharide biosynthesis glycosyltransferase
MAFSFFKKSAVHVAYSVDANFALPLSVSAYSLLENFRSRRELHLHIVYVGAFPEYAKKQIQRTLEPVTKTNIHIHFYSEAGARIQHLRADLHYSPAIYARFCLPEILPQSLRRVLYLDADTLVLNDVSELFDAKFRGNPVLAARDWTTTLAHPLLCIEDLAKYDLNENSPNFNSGVLLFDLTEWRAKNYGEQLLEFAERERLLHDQNAMNIVLHGKIGVIDPRWNKQFVYRKVISGEWQMPFVEYAWDPPKLLHFLSEDKPWLPECKLPERKLYYRYWQKTSWPFPDEWESIDP